MDLQNKVYPDGLILRYKAQIVDPRFSQEYGLHYDETFSPMAKITIVQVPPTFVVNKDWKIWQMDMEIVSCMESWTRRST